MKVYTAASIFTKVLSCILSFILITPSLLAEMPSAVPIRDFQPEKSISEVAGTIPQGRNDLPLPPFPGTNPLSQPTAADVEKNIAKQAQTVSANAANSGTTQAVKFLIKRNPAGSGIALEIKANEAGTYSIQSTTNLGSSDWKEERSFSTKGPELLTWTPDDFASKPARFFRVSFKLADLVPPSPGIKVSSNSTYVYRVVGNEIRITASATGKSLTTITLPTGTTFNGVLDISSDANVIVYGTKSSSGSKANIINFRNLTKIHQIDGELKLVRFEKGSSDAVIVQVSEKLIWVLTDEMQNFITYPVNRFNGNYTIEPFGAAAGNKDAGTRIVELNEDHVKWEFDSKNTDGLSGLRIEFKDQPRDIQGIIFGLHTDISCQNSCFLIEYKDDEGDTITWGMNLLGGTVWPTSIPVTDEVRRRFPKVNFSQIRSVTFAMNDLKDHPKGFVELLMGFDNKQPIQTQPPVVPETPSMPPKSEASSNAAPFNLKEILAIEQPSLLGLLGSGNSLADAGIGRVLAGADLTTINGNTESGAAYILDTDPKSGTFGKVLVELKNPDIGQYDRFGLAVAVKQDDYYLVSAPLSDEAGFNAGSVYLYEANPKSSTYGKLIHTLTAPATSPGWFGESIEIVGGNIAITAGDVAGEQNVVYLYNGQKGNPNFGQLIHVFKNPAPGSEDSWGDNFGNTLKAFGDFLLIGANGQDATEDNEGVVYLFDANPASPKFGNLIHSFKDPSPQRFNRFGYSIEVVGNDILVGGQFTKDGDVYLFEGDPSRPSFGELIHTFHIPLGSPGQGFGKSLAVFNNHQIAIGNPETGRGAVYLYDANQSRNTFGKFLGILENPGTTSGSSFGWQLVSAGDQLHVLAPENLFFRSPSKAVFHIFVSDFSSGPALLAQDLRVIERELDVLQSRTEDQK
ncbi:MAG: hypothetical protein EXS63_03395 [Candidatus Omnitrophica bacterium]|nr:hypothetical protein [Candidatus Omnitrophota bacterium]